MKKIKEQELQVYFNSACPVCRVGIHAQMDKTTDCNVSWNDIHTNKFYALEADPDINVVRKYLHVIDNKDQKYIGIDAFIQLWKYSPHEQWKAKLFSLPMIKHFAKVVYLVFANILFAWNRSVGNWGK